MHFTIFSTAWGSFAFVIRQGKLVAAYLPDTETRIRRLLARSWSGAGEDPKASRGLQRQVIDYFKGKPARFTADLDLSDVPPFRRRVLEICRTIPF